MSLNSDVQFVKVDENTLIEFLNNAEKRIIIAKAGYRDSEAETLLGLVDQKNLECRVYIDPGENAVRWGLGQESALKELHKNSEKLNVQTHLLKVGPFSTVISFCCLICVKGRRFLLATSD